MKKATHFSHRELRNNLRKKPFAQKNHLFNKSKRFHTRLRNPFAHTSLPTQPRQQMCKAKHTSAGLPWEGAEVPRQLREVVCIPDSRTTQIFKQCLEQEKKKKATIPSLICISDGRCSLKNKYLKQLMCPQLLIGLSQNTEFLNSGFQPFIYSLSPSKRFWANSTLEVTFPALQHNLPVHTK